jgi:hypothetical protein
MKLCDKLRSVIAIQKPLNLLGSQLTDGIFGALIVRQSARVDPHFKEYDVDDPNHVIVINEWRHGFAIQRLLEPNPGTGSASLLVNGRSQPKVRDSARDIFLYCHGVDLLHHSHVQYRLKYIFMSHY